MARHLQITKWKPILDDTTGRPLSHNNRGQACAVSNQLAQSSTNLHNRPYSGRMGKQALASAERSFGGYGCIERMVML